MLHRTNYAFMLSIEIQNIDWVTDAFILCQPLILSSNLAFALTAKPNKWISLFSIIRCMDFHYLFKEVFSNDISQDSFLGSWGPQLHRNKWTLSGWIKYMFSSSKWAKPCEHSWGRTLRNQSTGQKPHLASSELHRCRCSYYKYKCNTLFNHKTSMLVLFTKKERYYLQTLKEASIFTAIQSQGYPITFRGRWSLMQST